MTKNEAEIPVASIPPGFRCLVTDRPADATEGDAWSFSEPGLEPDRQHASVKVLRNSTSMTLACETP